MSAIHHLSPSSTAGAVWKVIVVTWGLCKVVKWWEHGSAPIVNGSVIISPGSGNPDSSGRLFDVVSLWCDAHLYRKEIQCTWKGRRHVVISSSEEQKEFAWTLVTRQDWVQMVMDLPASSQSLFMQNFWMCPETKNGQRTFLLLLCNDQTMFMADSRAGIVCVRQISVVPQDFAFRSIG